MQVTKKVIVKLKNLTDFDHCVFVSQLIPALSVFETYKLILLASGSKQAVNLKFCVIPCIFVVPNSHKNVTKHLGPLSLDFSELHVLSFCQGCYYFAKLSHRASRLRLKLNLKI